MPNPHLTLYGRQSSGPWRFGLPSGRAELSHIPAQRLCRSPICYLLLLLIYKGGFLIGVSLAGSSSVFSFFVPLFFVRFRHFSRFSRFDGVPRGVGSTVVLPCWWRVFFFLAWDPDGVLNGGERGDYVHDERGVSCAQREKDVWGKEWDCVIV